ncbi:MAG: hypothetical protein WB801_09900, partial [Candidatus Dormiibacterota bacterium]
LPARAPSRRGRAKGEAAAARGGLQSRQRSLMSVTGSILGLLFLVGSIAGLALMPRPDGLMAPLVRLGRGTRRWWVLSLAVAAPILVGVVASLPGSESRPFVLLLVVVTAVPLLLACVWAWARARSFS